MKFDFSKEPGKTLNKQNIREEISPELSIITPFYNAGANFWQTYNCVINQTFEKFEWVIVNDGSTKKEDTEFLEQLASKDSRIKVYNQENSGQSKAKNNGIAKAKSEIIVFLDADDLIESFYLEVLYEALKRHPNAAWSYTDLVGFAAHEYVWCKSFSAGRMTFNNILVNAAAFRKSAIDAVGGFPEIAKHYDEDWALYLQLLGKKYHPVHVPVIGFWYRKSETGMQQTVRKDEKLRRESDRFIRELSMQVDVRICEELYDGYLPEDAVRSTYSKMDMFLAKVMRRKIGTKLIRGIYTCRK